MLLTNLKLCQHRIIIRNQDGTFVDVTDDYIQAIKLRTIEKNPGPCYHAFNFKLRKFFKDLVRSRPHYMTYLYTMISIHQKGGKQALRHLSSIAISNVYGITYSDIPDPTFTNHY